MNLDMISIDDQALAARISQTLFAAVSDRNASLVYDLLAHAELSEDDAPLSSFECFFLVFCGWAGC